MIPAWRRRARFWVRGALGLGFVVGVLVGIQALQLETFSPAAGPGKLGARERPANRSIAATPPDRSSEALSVDSRSERHLAELGPSAILPPELPDWLRDAVDLDDAPRGPIFINRAMGAGPPLNPRHLAVLQDIIDLNRLDESSAARDFDNRNGMLEPLELGFQVWRGGQLIALSLGADPYSSFGYQIDRLPTSIGDLNHLQLLDVQSNRLVELPYEIGTLSELRELRAHRNELIELPDSFSRLTRLRGVHLSQNDLTELPDSIGDLAHLEWLYVSDNPLEELPHSLGRLQNLRTLGLQNTGTDPSRPHAAGAGEAFDGLAVLPGELESLGALDTLYVTGNDLGCAGGGAAIRIATGSDSRVFGLSAQRCSP